MPSPTKEREAIAKYWWNEELTASERLYWERIAIRLTTRAHRMGVYGLWELMLAIRQLIEEKNDGITTSTNGHQAEEIR